MLSPPQNVLKPDEPSLAERWPVQLAEHIRQNDQPLLEQTDQLLEFYQHDVLPCASFEEFADVLGLLELIPNPALFLEQTLKEYAPPQV